MVMLLRGAARAGLCLFTSRSISETQRLMLLDVLLQPSHCNSLKDLLTAHKVVKVKFISDDVGAEEAETLGSGSEGAFLQQKGATMMFAKGEDSCQ